MTLASALRARRSASEGAITGTVPFVDSQGRGFPQGGVFNAALDAVIVMTHDGLVSDFNPAAERIFGRRREDVIGQELASLIVPPALRDQHRSALARFLDTRKARILDRRLELVAIRADGSEFPVELTVTRVPDHEPPLFAGFIRDLTERDAAAAEREDLIERERLVRAEATEARSRLQLFADAGVALQQALTLEDALWALPPLAVPEVADACVVDYLRDGRRLDPAVAHAAVSAAPSDAIEGRNVDLDGESPLATALRTRMWVEQDRLIVVPLLARDRLLGAVSFALGAARAPFTDGDVATARELSRRAALAIDNLRLYEETRRIAHALQTSLLPPALPPVPGLRLTARYRAAGEGQDVGGDFYDVFEFRPGVWAMVMGDVCGKGPKAAALTALARYTIRAAAAGGYNGPAKVLEILNDTLLRDPAVEGQFLTAVFATIEPGAERHAIRIATAGHPAPLLVRSGEVEWVRAEGCVLGVLEEPRIVVADRDMARGDSLVLYTDGLTDAGAPDRIISEADLAAVAEAASAGGSRLADALEGAALEASGGAPRDDIALLVAEAAPERRQRPRSVIMPGLRA